MTFIEGCSPLFDWFCTERTYQSTDRWSPVKTKYDPCPPGWKVPENSYMPRISVWAAAFNYWSPWKTVSNWDQENNGMDFSLTDRKLGDGTIWYPYTGYYGMTPDSGDRSCYYHSCTFSGDYVYCLQFSSDGGIYALQNDFPAGGSSVRCLKDAK